ncbi:glycohydrolase toxin TNT-related protein [Xenorhabdus sp. 38]|nr:glycohydrolase toxin TNT-related protein [Xenorhabdus sp. 38]
MNPYGYVHNPLSWVDPHGLSGTSVVPPSAANSFEVFQNRSKGMFSTEADARKAYDLLQKKDWTTLEKMMPPGSWPPNGGFADITPTILQPGTKIDRFGGRTIDGKFVDTGDYAAQAGALFEVRALPADSITRPYNVYEVIKPLKADMGPAIPWFGQPGMGTQYQFKKSISDLIDQGYIK